MTQIHVDQLSKIFFDKKRGEVLAVNSVSLSANSGEIFGILGPNGAGKTTLLRMLATILTPSSGTAQIGGFDIVKEPEKVRQQIGYLTGAAGLYDRLTAREALHYFGALYGMNNAEIAARIEALNTRLSLTEFLDRRCDKLSTGQKQRVAIARSVLHDPPVVFFDEPTSGLDIMSAREVIRYIRHCRELGKCVVFSTHIMSEVEALCDRIAIIHDGKVAAIGTLDELRKQANALDAPFETVFLRLIGVHED
jgi:sodium transport system ATP-binding protein